MLTVPLRYFDLGVTDFFPERSANQARQAAIAAFLDGTVADGS
jgi:hypothetical protein